MCLRAELTGCGDIKKKRAVYAAVPVSGEMERERSAHTRMKDVTWWHGYWRVRCVCWGVDLSGIVDPRECSVPAGASIETVTGE